MAEQWATVYVDNLAWAVTTDDLRRLFAPFGAVTKVWIPAEADGGPPCDFGYVEMANAEEASRAIRALNGAEHQHRRLTVELESKRVPIAESTKLRARIESESDVNAPHPSMTKPLIRAIRSHPIIVLEPEDEFAVSDEESAPRPPLTRAIRSHPLIVLEAEDEFAVDSQ